MEERKTTIVIQCYLDQLADNQTADDAIRNLLEQSVRRLSQLCTVLLYRSYPRLSRPPLNLQTEELLSAVVERLLKAMRDSRPQSVRQFFALAGQHTRWELNDLARRLDRQVNPQELPDNLVADPYDADSGLSIDSRRMFEAIDQLPLDEREAFDLVRIQGLSNSEAAELLGVSPKTVKRRLDRGIQMLVERLEHLRPSEPMSVQSDL